jgi:hypothetical protein
MRGLIAVAALAIGLALGATASAEPTLITVTPPEKAATTVAPAIAQASPEDKMVCKTETPTGSRLGGHRVCMKKSDWQAQAQDARRQRDFAPPAGIAGQR